jgi:hypothetical protein
MGTTEEALNFEREPQPVEAQKPVWREATFSITRNLWSMHAMSHRVLEVLGLVSGKVLSMAEGSFRDPESEYERGRRDGQRYSGGYQEAPKGDGNLKSVIIGCTVVLVSGGIVGAITFSNQFSEFRGQVLQWQKSMEAQQKQVEARLDRLENRRQ